MLRNDLSQGCKILAAFNDLMHKEAFRAGAQHLIDTQIVSKRNLELLSRNIKLAPLTGQLLVILYNQRLLSAQTRKIIEEKLTSNNFQKCCELLQKYLPLNAELYFKLIKLTNIAAISGWLEELDRRKSVFTAEKTAAIFANYIEHLDAVERLISKFSKKDWCVDTIAQLQREHPKRLPAITAALDCIPDELLEKESILLIAGIQVRQQFVAKALAVLLKANIKPSENIAINFIMSTSQSVDSHPVKHFFEIEAYFPEVAAAKLFVILKKVNLHKPEDLALLLQHFQNQPSIFKDLVKLEAWINATKPADIHLIINYANNIRTTSSVTTRDCLFADKHHDSVKSLNTLETQSDMRLGSKNT